MRYEDPVHHSRRCAHRSPLRRGRERPAYLRQALSSRKQRYEKLTGRLDYEPRVNAFLGREDGLESDILRRSDNLESDILRRRDAEEKRF